MELTHQRERSVDSRKRVANLKARAVIIKVTLLSNMNYLSAVL